MRDALGQQTLGSDVERLQREVDRLTRGIQAAEVDTQNAEMALRVERRKVKELQRALEDQAVGTDFKDELRLVFDYWRRRCRHPKAKLGTERANAMKARLNAGHTVEDLLRAVDGAMFAAFEADGRRHDELELVMRNEVKFDSFTARWQATVLNGPLRVPLGAYCLPAGQVEPEWDALDQAWRYKCPVCLVGWAHDDFYALKASPQGLFCDGACVELTPAVIREALLGFPRLEGRTNGETSGGGVPADRSPEGRGGKVGARA